MRSLFLLFIVLGLGGQLAAQVRVPFGSKHKAVSTAPKTVSEKVKAPRITVPELVKMLDWTQKQVDTTLKKKGYLLMEKDVDSTSSLFQYSHLSRETDAPTTVRSLALMDATVRDIKGRMISYRTYDKEEFSEISSYLLANNYRKTNEFAFEEAKHSIYNNGSQEIRIKVITTVKDKRRFVAYELELGK